MDGRPHSAGAGRRPAGPRRAGARGDARCGDAGRVHSTQVLLLLESLEQQAVRAGGRVHVLLGNHETMSVAGDFRYAFRGACTQFQVP